MWLFVAYLRPWTWCEPLQSLQAHRPPSILWMPLILSLKHLGLCFLLSSTLLVLENIARGTFILRRGAESVSLMLLYPAVYMFCGSVFLRVVSPAFTKVLGTKAFSFYLAKFCLLQASKVIFQGFHEHQRITELRKNVWVVDKNKAQVWRVKVRDRINPGKNC